jgi:hypothetical protein
MILPGETEAGTAGTQPCRGIKQLADGEEFESPVRSPYSGFKTRWIASVAPQKLGKSKKTSGEKLSLESHPLRGVRAEFHRLWRLSRQISLL